MASAFNDAIAWHRKGGPAQYFEFWGGDADTATGCEINPGDGPSVFGGTTKHVNAILAELRVARRLIGSIAFVGTAQDFLDRTKAAELSL